MSSRKSKQLKVKTVKYKERQQEPKIQKQLSKKSNAPKTFC